MKNVFLIFAFVCLFFAGATAQTVVGIGTNTPHASAAVEVKSTTQGMLVPRMTEAQRVAIAAPATGLLLYQTDGTAGFYFYNGSWTSLSGGSGSTQTLTGIKKLSFARATYTLNATNIADFAALPILRSGVLAGVET